MDGLIEFFVKRKAPLEIVRGIEFYLPDAASDRCERGLTLVGQGGQSNIYVDRPEKNLDARLSDRRLIHMPGKLMSWSNRICSLT